MYLVGPKRGSTFRAAGHLGVSAGQCASCNNKAFLPIMDSHRVKSGRVQKAGNISGSGLVGSRFSWAGSGRTLKFGPACNSVVDSMEQKFRKDRNVVPEISSRETDRDTHDNHNTCAPLTGVCKAMNASFVIPYCR